MRRYMWNAENCWVPCLRGIIINIIKVKVCLTLCDHMDRSPPGSSVHGILQARILEWVAVPFSRDLPDSGIEPWSPALEADSLPSELAGEPLLSLSYFLFELLSKNISYLLHMSRAWLQIKTRQTIDFEFHGFLLWIFIISLQAAPNFSF